MASDPHPPDVPSPIDFRDIEQARAWVAETLARRPWRLQVFEAFAEALNTAFRRPITVAELGSGPGHLAQAILRGCYVSDYAAIDLSRAMHDLAREHLGPTAASVNFLERDFRERDWRSGLAVDAVVTLQAAHEVRHRARLPALFEEVREALRPGGLFLYCDHYAEGGEANAADLYLRRDEQPRALEAAGFVDVRRLLDVGGMALWSARRP